MMMFLPAGWFFHTIAALGHGRNKVTKKIICVFMFKECPKKFSFLFARVDFIISTDFICQVINKFFFMVWQTFFYAYPLTYGDRYGKVS
jgi:hypothetical protein